MSEVEVTLLFPLPLLYPSLGVENFVHHASFSGLLRAYRSILLKFSFRIVFEDHARLDLTENIMCTLNYCDFFKSRI